MYIVVQSTCSTRRAHARSPRVSRYAYRYFEVPEGTDLNFSTYSQRIERIVPGEFPAKTSTNQISKFAFWKSELSSTTSTLVPRKFETKFKLNLDVGKY